jgi:predicted ester cyclase
MDRTEMVRLFEAHREAEAARDIDAILETFNDDCFLETMPLGLRSEGRDAVRAAYEQQFFTAFPDLAPDDEGIAYNDEDDFVIVWGTLRGTSTGEWLGVPPGGGRFSVPLANVVPFSLSLPPEQASDDERREATAPRPRPKCWPGLGSLSCRLPSYPRSRHFGLDLDRYPLERTSNPLAGSAGR